MMAFHKIYLRLFESLDFSIESKLFNQLKAENVEKIYSIKRTWIYGIFINSLVFATLFLNLTSAYISYNNFYDNFWWIILPVSHIIVSIILVINSFTYILHYRKHHKYQIIETNIDEVIQRTNIVTTRFLNFFNISVLTSIFLYIIFFETVVYLYLYYKPEYFFVAIVEILCVIFSIFMIHKHRKYMMNLELDFGIVSKWRVYIIDQNGLLSTKQSIVSQNIKNIEWKYNSLFWSFFWFWQIKFFLEWNLPQEQWVISLDYVANPRKSIDFINTVLKNDTKL